MAEKVQVGSGGAADRAGNLVGYARVSTRDQTVALQLDAGSVKNLGRYAASWIAGWPRRLSCTAALTWSTR